MITLLKNIPQLVRVESEGKLVKAGSEMQDLSIINNGAMIFDYKILWIGVMEDLDNEISKNNFIIDFEINCDGNAVIPGFVDSHTHVVFGGNRVDEFGKRLRGYSYTQIAEEGGGIQKTVKATRESSIEDLYNNGLQLIDNAIIHGTTAIEIKSGYSLNLEGEIKQLKAIKKLKNDLSIDISSTFLGAHDFPIEYSDKRDDYVELICKEMLPLVAKENLADYCDAFVDKGYYTVEQATKIFNKAKELGMKIRVHADELADVSAAKMAAELNAVSADHLLFISDESIDEMKKSGTIASLLPGTAYFIRMPYAPARKLIEKNVPVALATDCNPGSCFTENMQIILSLAVINMKMTAEEALTAATINGAAALNKSEKFGSLEVGKDANFLILNTDNYINMFYHFGINHVKETWINGKKYQSI